MAQFVGLFMILIGIAVFFALSLKLLLQPFIPKDLYFHEYFPSTELVLGIPILSGTLFFAGFGIYILKIMVKNNLQVL